MDLATIDIEQLVAFEGYEYRLSNGNSGPQLNVKTCPACHREDYKVYFNADSGFGNCFGCGVTLNPYKFVKYARGLDQPARIFNYLESHSTKFTYKPRAARVYVDNRLNKDWKLPLNTKIELDEQVPDYLTQRGINAKIAKRFDLRLCESGFYNYYDFDGRARFVDFSDRIIIPIYDIHGKPATFQGRDITGSSPRKYLFPNMLPGTARYIYNADYIVKNRIKRVVLNEGVFDVFAGTLALESEVGYQEWGACGTFGKNFSIQKNVYEAEDQLADLAYLKANGVEEFVIMWDGEPKARLAAIEATLKLRSYDFNVTVALGLPDGCDPNECSKRDYLKALDTRIVPTKMTLVKHRVLSERI